MRTTLVSLLHYIISAYPSQGLFYKTLHALPPSFLPKDSPEHRWLSSLTSSLRSRNYVRFEELTRPAAFAHLLDDNGNNENQKKPGSSPAAPHSLFKGAFNALVDTLRTISRNTTWSVIRGAYRELSFRVESEGTRDWLMRTLALRPVIPETIGVSVEKWLEDKAAEGHVRPKEGVDGKYIICKVR